MHILLYFRFYILCFISYFYSFYFMHTSLVLYSTIFALSMERTWLTFHCWLYTLCIVVYVTNKTWTWTWTWCECAHTQIQKFEVGNFFFLFFFERNEYSARTHTFKWSKSDSKDIYNVTKYFYFIHNFLFIKEKTYHAFHKNIKHFLEHQISILKWFLKDHVTLIMILTITGK